MINKLREKPLLAGALLLLVIILLVIFGMPKSFPHVSGNRWQAVFLTNNQVYFGHIKNTTKDYIALTNIFYLQAIQPLQQGAESIPQLSLVKLGNELHGPEDVMYIPKNVILFWENLRDDSQVVQTIKSNLGQTQ